MVAENRELSVISEVLMNFHGSVQNRLEKNQFFLLLVQTFIHILYIGIFITFYF